MSTNIQKLFTDDARSDKFLEPFENFIEEWAESIDNETIWEIARESEEVPHFGNIYFGELGYRLNDAIVSYMKEPDNWSSTIANAIDNPSEYFDGDKDTIAKINLLKNSFDSKEQLVDEIITTIRYEGLLDEDKIRVIAPEITTYCNAIDSHFYIGSEELHDVETLKNIIHENMLNNDFSNSDFGKDVFVQALDNLMEEYELILTNTAKHKLG